MSSVEAAKALLQQPAPQYQRAVSPRLRKLLYVVFALVAVLGANAMYLASITFLSWYGSLGQQAPVTYEDLFYQYMFLLHLALGILLIGPVIVFGVAHMFAARKRRNRRAVRIGYALFSIAILLLISGVLLMRVGGLEVRDGAVRRVFYWLHVISPLAAIWLYWLHRLAGPRIKWRIGLAYLAAVAIVVAGMVGLKLQDPRKWNAQGPPEGAQYFEPSLTRTASGKFIPARVLMNDEYCKKCHPDVYDGWFHSAHHLSSFNNHAYLMAVRETREAVLRRDGTVKASRWCAGCHDPVPFLSGAFDDPDFDDIGHFTAHAGITCTVCHSITGYNSVRGNGDYTIEEPQHYPFAFSENPILQWVNETLVKAKPEFHKKTFLKPMHKQAEFCSTCHKVHLPKALNAYKEFLRGQNHYDSYLLSGVSGHGARSFYYPAKAEQNCNECHMPPQPSNDFGAKRMPGVDGLAVHDHLFYGANTAVTWLRGDEETPVKQQKFLRDGVVRVDLFGIRDEVDVTSKLHAPLRPSVPALAPGKSYMLETVIRTLKMGHHFTQGTTDSNQIWLELTVRSGGEVLAHSGAMDPQGRVDQDAHFVNNFVIDRQGNRISRRNAQDIFVAAYDHQIPPGAAQTVHYRLDIPPAAQGPIEVHVQLHYRKFDKQYTDFIAASLRRGDVPARGLSHDKPNTNPLPVTTLAEDRVVFPLAGEQPVEQDTPDWPVWQRWNDYGIGMLVKGTKELRQAAEAFAMVDRYDGPLNLARALLREGFLDEAGEALAEAAARTDPPPPPWTVAWLAGEINLQQDRLPEAQRNFEKVLFDRTPEMRERGFDFSKDYVVINLLGQTLYDQAKQLTDKDDAELRQQFLEAARDQFLNTLQLDPENLTAHHNLHLIFERLGQQQQADYHRQQHLRYKPDDSAVEAIKLARAKYPAVDHAVADLVIYELKPARPPIQAPGAQP